MVKHSGAVFGKTVGIQLPNLPCALVLQALGVSDHFPVEFELKAKGGFFDWLKSKFSKKRRPRNSRRSSS